MKYNPVHICGRKNRQGKPCRRPAGWGTDYAGEEGRACKLHGGKSTGAPKGNKNAVKTGEFEAIWIDTLDEEEQQLYHMINDQLPLQIEEELKLITIRERRMLQRIETIQQQAEESGNGLVGENLEIVQSIEDGLTRVQDKKAKLLDLKHKISAFSDIEGEDNLLGLTSIIEESTRLLSQTVRGKYEKGVNNDGEEQEEN